MARKIKYKEIRPSFFKVLIGDFTKQLSMPPAFVKNFNGSSSLGQCIIKSPTRKYWAVNVEEQGNLLCFGSGWKEFVEAHSLEVGDFLVFKYCGNSKFKVKIYDKSCCEKVTKPAQMNNDHPTLHSNSNNGNQNAASIRTQEYKREIFEAVKGNNPINLDKSECRTRSYQKKLADIEGASERTRILSFKSKNSCFILTWTVSNVYRGIIPVKLAKEKRLMKQSTLLVKDEAGRSWSVELRVSTGGHLEMTRGRWLDFWKANGIAFGDTVIFEFTKPTVLQVHIFRKVGRVIPIKTTEFTADVVKKFEAQ